MNTTATGEAFDWWVGQEADYHLHLSQYRLVVCCQLSFVAPFFPE